MCRLSLRSFKTCSRLSGSCCNSGSRTAKLLTVMLCVLILLLSGCGTWAERTQGTLTAAPLTPGAIVTDDWSYERGGKTVVASGTWVHLPADEAGNLLLWIQNVEGAGL